MSSKRSQAFFWGLQIAVTYGFLYSFVGFLQYWLIPETAESRDWIRWAAASVLFLVLSVVLGRRLLRSQPL
ncbi:MAG: hypothetical protein AAF604_19365 [Acidobacteriota bacterium]